MDKPKGWVKYWKKSMDDELYNCQPFDEWHAWTDLILLADSEGKVETTVKALKIRWKWNSYKQVRAYLGKLKGKGMVKVEGKPTGSTIRLCKYWVYQTSADAKKKQKGQTLGQTSGQTKGQVRSTLSTEGGCSLPTSVGSEPQEEIEKPFDPSEGDWDDE